MIRLEKNKYDQLYHMYLDSGFVFPLISAVLLDQQDGIIFVDDPAVPSQIYVEHNFGFAQIFGTSTKLFEESLERYLLIDKKFSINKIRLYTPVSPTFMRKEKYQSLCSFRQRFGLSNSINFASKLKELISKKDSMISARKIDATNIVDVGEEFDGVVTRFWRTASDFVQKSRAIIVYYQNKPASLCYAAASDGRHLEIDVITLPKYRNLGLAKIAVLHFIEDSLSLSLSPLWDCFTNNIGSMKLCDSVGFAANNAPYPFYTINK